MSAVTFWDAFVFGVLIALGGLLPQILIILTRELLDLLGGWRYRGVGAYTPIFLPTLRDEHFRCQSLEDGSR